MGELMLINDINLPKPIFDAMRNDEYTPGNADYTPSSLTIGAKEYWGRKLFKNLSRKASTSWASFTGTLMHLGLEHLLAKYKEYKRELHIEISFNDNSKTLKLINDRIIGGTVDLLEVGDKIILWDYKTMSTTQLITEDKIQDWTLRANIYRWLLILSGNVTKIDKLIYIPIFKDWTKTKSDRSYKVDNTPCPIVILEKWHREKIEQYIYDKVTEIETYKDVEYDSIPICSKVERWEDPTLWKVYKVTDGVRSVSCIPGGKCETEQDAQNLVANKLIKCKANESYVYEMTGGIPKKCVSWCSLGTNGVCKYDK